MKLTITVDESDTMSVAEIGEKIAKAQGWKCDPYPSNDPSMSDTVVMTTPVGRMGMYDVINDVLTWNDDPNETEYCFFDGDDEFFLANSLLEFLDVSTAIWGVDEDDEWVLYVEL